MQPQGNYAGSCPTPVVRNARRDRLSWVDDARHRFVAPSPRRSAPFSAPRDYSHSDRELRCDAADGFQIKLSSAAPATNSQRPASICPQRCRPTHLPPKPPPNQIPIDGQPLTRPPRVPFFGGFRTPALGTAAQVNDGPTSETLHGNCCGDVRARCSALGRGITSAIPPPHLGG
jgi:hypothetical protein